MLIPGKLDFIVTDSRWIRTGNTHSSCYCIDFKKQDLISYTVATFYRSLPTGLHEVTATLNYTVYITLPTPLQLLTASQLNAVPSH